jgi:hypothetical protein
MTTTPSKQVLDQIAEMEKQYGVSSYEAPVGVHHVVFDDNTGVQDQGESPRFRMEMQIICGPLKGQKMNSFQGYFASSNGDRTKAIEDRRKGARSFLVRTIGDVARGLTDGTDVLKAWGQLPIDNNEEDSGVLATAANAMSDLGEALQGQQIYVKAGNTDNGPTFKFIRTGDKSASCECTHAGQALDFLNEDN